MIKSLKLIQRFDFDVLSSESQLRSLSEDKRYAYVTYSDLKSIAEYRDNTVMAVRAPPETKLQVCHHRKFFIYQTLVSYKQYSLSGTSSI